jgi:hypothetical protein
MSITIRRSLVLLVSVLVLIAGVFVVQRANAASQTPVVYVATGENFPDALGAAAAAAVQGGPVLLVQKDSIPAVTAAELSRLAPDVIYVSGGTAVVSDTVFNALKGYAPTVTRVAGANRYATAVEVSKSAFPATGGGSAALEAQVAALSAEVDALQAMLAGVSRDGDTLLFTGMNLQVVNGTGTTGGEPNGLGSVIIGYNEVNPDALRGSRVGSHYLVIGEGHAYTRYAGIITGYRNTASGVYSSVTGGFFNTASGQGSSVTGGYDNTASGAYSSVTGGYLNTASGHASSVTGGYNNTASGEKSSVLGGHTVTLSIAYGTDPN